MSTQAEAAGSRDVSLSRYKSAMLVERQHIHQDSWLTDRNSL